ncbi:MAG: TMEM14 family protein [Acidobacteriota bacterium]
MNITAYAVIIYGILVILGGLIGYLQASSKASLIAGGVSGAVLILSGWLMLDYLPTGTYLALLVAVALAILFGKRFAAKQAFMPAGLMLLLSVLMTAVLLLRLFWP